MKRISTLSTGKIVLAGEYAVMRGGPSVVTSDVSRSLRLVLSRTSKVEGMHESWNLVRSKLSPRQWELWVSVLRELELEFDISDSILNFEIQTTSTVPIQKGLGSSAAFCWCITQALEKLSPKVSPAGADGSLAVARKLESVFHLESSGMDIAGVMLGTDPESVALYQDGKVLEKVAFSKKSQLTLEELPGAVPTAQAVERFQELARVEPHRVSKILDRMNSAALEAWNVIRSSEPLDLERLSAALELAHTVFQDLDLSSPHIETARAKLKQKGALASKLTGKGLGGYLLVLWPESR